jgi:RNA polymerase sigma-B factor
VGSAVPGTENPMVRLSGGALPPATPTPHDDAALLDRYHRERDARDREALVQRYLPLARHLSRRYYNAGEREDLEQVASLGLLKAIDRYDPTRGIAFTSFAVPTILGELKRYFRDLGWSVRVPRSLKELAAKVDGATEQMLIESGRPPTVEELARRLDTDAESILEARQLATAHHATSLDVPLADDSDATLIDTIASDDDGYQYVEDSADLDRLLAALPDRERTILRLRFRDDMTQREISQRVGLSQMHVSRLISGAIAELSRLASDAPPRRRSLM